jgi:hypothetical protein
MLITVRRFGQYADVSVSTVHGTLEIGLLTEIERKQLAEHLREISEELTD